MRENKSGAWLLHCVSTGSIGGHIVVNGEEVKKGYIPKDSISSLKVTGVCSVLPSYSYCVLCLLQYVFQCSHDRNLLHS